MDEEILALAQTLTGARKEETQVLALLCAASRQEWEAKLRRDVAAGTCRGALVCAAALSGAAGLAAARGGGETAGFTAGNVSVTHRSAGETGAAARALLDQAARLMAPYVEPEDFCFRGVRG